MNTRLFIVVAAACLAAATARAYVYNASDFATSVIQYTPGGVTSDFINHLPYDNPACALGRPTIDTTGDGTDIPLGSTVPVCPVAPAFRSFEIVSVGVGGSLTLSFDHLVANDPDNPFGVDFIVFGNSFIDPLGAHWHNGDPNALTIGSGGYTDPGRVSVSADGNTWYTFSSPFADSFAPTLGRTYDPAHPDTSIGSWNQWWSVPTDPTYPLSPALGWNDYYGDSLADMATSYGRSAGGTGFDLAALGPSAPSAVRYVRIQPNGAAVPEVDAIADVAEAAEPGIVPGDANRDHVVDVVDLGLLATNWKKTGSCVWAQGDFNFDDKIDVVDLGLLATNWRYGQSPAPVPAPSAAVMLLASLPAILRRRRNSR